MIGRRVANRAVDRNYCKRQVRETFRKLQGKFIGLDVVVRFQKPWDHRLKDELSDEILKLFLALGRCPN